MLRREFIAASAATLATASWDSAAASRKVALQVINVMPTFWRFWDDTIGQPDEVRARAFFETVVAAYPDLFQHGLIASGPLTGLGDDPQAQQRVTHYLRDLPPWIPAMRAISTGLPQHVARSVDAFAKAFSDYAPRTPVYFTVSMLGLSAGMNLSGETTGLYFGIDELARAVGNTPTLKLVIVHELFHQYHHQIAPQLSTNRAAWATLWEEGLATYVSHRMNPGTTVDDALVVPPRLSELAQPHLRALAQRFLDDPDATDSPALNALFAADPAPPGLPARSAYYLGFRVAERLGMYRSLSVLAHLHGATLKRSVLQTLIALSTAP